MELPPKTFYLQFVTGCAHIALIPVDKLHVSMYVAWLVRSCKGVKGSLSRTG